MLRFARAPAIMPSRRQQTQRVGLLESLSPCTCPSVPISTSHTHSQTVCLTNGAEVHHQLLRLMNINLPWADRAPSLCLLFLISFFLEGSPVVARAIAGELRCLGDLTTDAANK